MRGRWRGYLVIAVASAIALYGVVTAATAGPDAGVGFTDDGSSVAAVLPGSPVWRDGIRPGDMVVELHDSASPGGWELLATRSDGARSSAASSHAALLRQTLPAAILGAALTLLASILVLQGLHVGWALIPIAVDIATMPLLRTGNPADLALAGSGAFLVAGAALLVEAPRRHVAWFVSGSAVVLAAAWLVAIRVTPEAFDLLDAARLPFLVVCSLVALALVTDRRRLLRRLAAPVGPNPLDLVYLPAVFTLALVGLLVLDLPALLVVGVAAVLVLVYPSARRASARVFERAVIGDVRRRAELRAIEQERGRLARDIHDAPLQELAAVIRQLDARPDLPAETAALRQVAAQLREVVTALRPPVLEDLGLVAALEDLGDALREANPGWAVTVQVDDLLGPGTRVEPDLETAAFRIVQQACANAVQHSGGRALTVEGSVAAAAIDLVITDDGPAAGGASPQTSRPGHFGLDSMRDRAASVSGTLEVERDARAHTVRFRWEAAE